jgi:hypothetical protein
MPQELSTAPGDSDAAGDRDDMARSDTANGERPEQPESSERSARECQRAGEYPVGEEQAAVNRAEEPPA